MDATSTRNWMSDFQDTKIMDLRLVGTHNSGAYTLRSGEQVGRKFPQFVVTLFGRILRSWALCQSMRVYEQLVSGVRFLDLRVSRVRGEFHVSHTLVGPKLSDVVEQITRFLSESPTEVVIIDIGYDWEYKGLDLTSQDRDELNVYLVDAFRGRGQFMEYEGDHNWSQRNSDMFTSSVGTFAGRAIINVHGPRTAQGSKQFKLQGRWLDSNDRERVLMQILLAPNGRLNNLQTILTPQTRDIVKGAVPLALAGISFVALLIILASRMRAAKRKKNNKSRVGRVFFVRKRSLKRLVAPIISTVVLGVSTVFFVLSRPANSLKTFVKGLNDEILEKLEKRDQKSGVVLVVDYPSKAFVSEVIQSNKVRKKLLTEVK